MKFRESLVAELRKERRPSRRSALMAFVRRYSRRDVPVTSWRGSGDTANAVLSFLSACGLKDGASVKLTRSALDPSAWRLAFTAGDPLVDEFVNCCRDAGGPNQAGVPKIDAVIAAAYAGRDIADLVEHELPEDSPEPEEQPPADGRCLGSALAERTAQILSSVAERQACGGDSVESATIRLAREMLAAQVRPVVAPLAVVEVFVRRCLPASAALSYDGYAGRVPDNLVFVSDYQARLGAPTRVRPLAAGDQDIPLRALTSAPMGYLDGTITDIPNPFVDVSGPYVGSPVHGYLLESLSEMAPADYKDAASFLAVGNAGVVGTTADADVRIANALLAANDPVAFWDYVRWLYDSAYNGIAACWLTPYLRVGFARSTGRPFALADNPVYACPLSDTSSLFYRGDDAASHGLRLFGAAVFAVVLRTVGYGNPAAPNGCAAGMVCQPSRAIEVGSEDEERQDAGADPDDETMYLGKRDLPVEWFLLTHSTGMALDGRRERPLCCSCDSTSSATLSENVGLLRSFRERAETNPARTLLPRCSFGRSPGMLGRPADNGRVEFHPASAFYSTLIALLRSFAPDVVTREWNGREPWSWSIHDPNSIVTAAYSGIETDLSPETAEEGGAFPRLPSYPLREFKSLMDGCAAGICCSDWDAAVRRFTGSIEVMSTRGAGMARMAQRTKGTERTKVLVVETNMDAAAFCRGLDADGVDAFDVRARELFVQTFGYRNSDVLCIADRSGRARDTCVDGAVYSAQLAWMLDPGNLAVAGARAHDDFYARSGTSPQGAADGSWWRQLVSFGAMVDESGRLYLVFRASGDAGLAASIGYRHDAGFPISPAAMAARSGMPGAVPSSSRVPRGLDTFGTLKEILSRRFGMYSPEEHRAIAGVFASDPAPRGRITPLFMPETTRAPGGRPPSREWFQSCPRIAVGALTRATPR